MQPRALECEPAPGGAARRRHADALLSRQILAGERSGSQDTHRGPLIDERAAGLAAARAELHHPVRSLHDGGIVLHHHDRVARVGEPAQQAEQPAGVGRVEADGGLVEDVEGIDEM